MAIIVLLLCAVGGALVASVLSLVPALHIYNVAGFIILATPLWSRPCPRIRWPCSSWG